MKIRKERAKEIKIKNMISRIKQEKGVKSNQSTKKIVKNLRKIR